MQGNLHIRKYQKLTIQKRTDKQAHQREYGSRISTPALRNPLRILRSTGKPENFFEQGSVPALGGISLRGTVREKIEIHEQGRQGKVLRNAADHRPERIALPQNAANVNHSVPPHVGSNR
jgi:hypothetical protein